MTDKSMTDTDRIIAAIESIGARIDRVGDRLDAMARADTADRSNNDAKLRAIRQFVGDILHIKERLDFVAANTKPLKFKVVRG